MEYWLVARCVADNWYARGMSEVPTPKENENAQSKPVHQYVEWCGVSGIC